MSKRILVEVRTIVTLELVKTLGLYADGEKVMFVAKFSDPDDPGDSYDYLYEFSAEAYTRGIQELLNKGSCELVDLSGDKLYIAAGRDGGDVFFDTNPFRWNPNNAFPTNWTVAQIALPGTSVTCKAEPVVRNVYVGPQCG